VPTGQESRAGFAALIFALFTVTLVSAGCKGVSGKNGDPPLKTPAVNVLTYHNDNARTGQNLNETTLTPANVNPAKFGKLTFLSVQGLVDAQPLYVSNLSIAGAPHNVLYVATEHDLVYAFDADTFAQLWQVSLLGDGETPSGRLDCAQIMPEIGITSTPVIDLKAGQHGAIYVVAMSKDRHHRYFHRLHALDLATGNELGGAPRAIEASVRGSGAGSKNGRTIFNPRQYEERAALLLANGIVYTTWASHCDHDPYTSWVIAYKAETLQTAGILNLTPNGSEGAIWMTGDGPAADEQGNIHLLTGNGTFDTRLDRNDFPLLGDFGNAFVKISWNGDQLAVADYFTMCNTVAESKRDEDLGSGGILLLPDVTDSTGKVRHLAVGAGKDQIIYVVDRDSMGKFDHHQNKIYQEIHGALGGGEFAKPAYFNGTLYYGAFMAPLKAFPITNGQISATPSSKTADVFDYPGTTPTISANGKSNGIIWAVQNAESGVLHAYDARNLSNELYNSESAGLRDKFTDNKFITPVIANGKVFVGTPTGVTVFGLLP
jgi:outer membrane protein assembly factor BamB